jgi:hypothetical protein
MKNFAKLLFAGLILAGTLALPAQAEMKPTWQQCIDNCPSNYTYPQCLSACDAYS